MNLPMINKVKENVRGKPTENDKPVWKSKTFWIGAITAIAPLFPPAAAWIAANPAAYSAIMGLVFMGLRAATNGRVTIK